jgi:hypothetical protein
LQTLKYLDNNIPLDPKIKEGWGLTHRERDGVIQIFVSDGTHKIHWADKNFKVFKSTHVFTLKYILDSLC